MAEFDLTEGVRRAFLAGVGAVALGAEKSQELMDDLISKGELTVEQGKALNAELTQKYAHIAKTDKLANTLTVSGKKVTAKYKTLKKKTLTYKSAKVLTVKNPQGALSYKKVKGNKKITINKKTGKVTVKKGLKKGTYKVTVKVTASGNGTYKKLAKNATFTIKVK